MNSFRTNTLRSASVNNCLSSKLRRFKIQEGVLTANVSKCLCEENDGNLKCNDEAIHLKKYFSTLKDNFREVKYLFEEITLKTNDPESFGKTDIDELKRDILELETKIRTAKQFIRSELLNLRNEEITLMEKPETSESLTSEERQLKRSTRIPIKGYNEIVPSPVRVMMNSQFKCLEVQKFHEFMKNSPNRYGGWNEYNHNAFIQIWNKYYGDNNEMIAIKSIEDTFSYQYFKEEVLHKISGSSGDSIDSHSKWYLEFLHLKLNQQRALIKWQENKKKIKPSRKARLILTEGSPVEDIKSPTNIKLCRKQNQCNVTDRNINNRRNRTTFDTFSKSAVEHGILQRNEKITLSCDLTEDGCINNSGVPGPSKKMDIRRLLKPTKQWLLKQGFVRETCEFNENVESIAKLHKPTWRLNLRD